MVCCVAAFFAVPAILGKGTHVEQRVSRGLLEPSCAELKGPLMLSYAGEKIAAPFVACPTREMLLDEVIRLACVLVDVPA